MLLCLLNFLIEMAEYEIRLGVNLRCTMTDKCTKCGRTESEIVSDAKTLGLLQEFQCGVYKCCQIVEWADEQSQAWFEAAQEDREDSSVHDMMTGLPHVDDSATDGVLVPVRLRRRQVPWYRHS